VFTIATDLVADTVTAPDGGDLQAALDAAEPGDTILLLPGVTYPDGVFDRDVFIAGQESIYPADNFFPTTVDEVGFADISAGDYRLLDSSPFKNSGTDGLDIGRDASALPGGSAVR
jgi:hypothetical protein